MRRALLYAAAFAAIVISGDRLLSLGCDFIVRQSQNRFAQMYAKNLQSNALLLGNSRMDRNLNSDVFQSTTGLRPLNLGLGGNHPCTSEALLLDYVDIYGPPKLMLIEVTQAVDSPQLMGEMMLFTSFSHRLQANAENADPKFMFFRRFFHVLTYNNDTFWRLASECFRTPPRRSLQNVISDAEINLLRNTPSTAWPVIPENLAALSRMLAFAHSRGIAVYFFIAPMWPDYRANIRNFKQWKASLQNALPATHLLDFSELYDQNRSFFNDGNHLNQAGSVAFTQHLAHVTLQAPSVP